MVKVKLAWGKQNFDLDIDQAQSVETLKTQIYTLTNVPVDRQKIMGLGGMLKPDADLSKVKIKEGQKVMLMGTAEGQELQAPEKKTVFEEDLSPLERAKILKESAPEPLRAGIDNLGNTCYMASMLQCLHAVPPIKEAALARQAGSFEAGMQQIGEDAGLAAGLQGIFKDLDLPTADSVNPLRFLTALRARYPQFAQRSTKGQGFMQQDAEECWTNCLSSFANVWKDGDSNVIDKTFGFTMKEEWKCLESDEPAEIRTSEARKLMCHMGTATEPVAHLAEGVKLSLKEKIEKRSPKLERDAQYEKTSVITTLPEYLTVHFVRFQWKAASAAAGTEASKTKITRKCLFPKNFDVYEFCEPDLQTVLLEGRRIQAKHGDDELARGPDAEPMETDEVKTPFANGQYELIAMVTHQGRDADGGHYMGWVRVSKADGKKQKEDRWMQADDDVTQNMDWKDMDLAGGRADTHLAYLCIYKKVNVMATKEDIDKVREQKASEDAAAASEPTPMDTSK